MGQVQWKTKDELEGERLASWRESAVVSKFQAKAALKEIGALARVRQLMRALPEDDLTRMAWEDAQVFKRNSPMVKGMAQELGMSDEHLDHLFEVAKGIEA